MKNVARILAPFLIILSCQRFDDPVEILHASQILGQRAYVVHQGILTFRDRQAFRDLSKELARKTGQELDEWESSHNFKSLRSQHEEAIQKEELCG